MGINGVKFFSRVVYYNVILIQIVCRFSIMWCPWSWRVVSSTFIRLEFIRVGNVQFNSITIIVVQLQRVQSQIYYGCSHADTTHKLVSYVQRLSSGRETHYDAGLTRSFVDASENQTVDDNYLTIIITDEFLLF